MSVSQQNGIEHAAPDAISQSGMELMTTFMVDSEKQLVNENYDFVSSTDMNANGKAYSSIYPKAGTQFYVKKNTDDSTVASIDTAFGAATWTLMSVMKDAGAVHGQANTGNLTSTVKDIDITQLLSGTVYA